MSRDLALKGRDEGVREKRVLQVVEFELDSIMQYFNENIVSIKDKFVVANMIFQEDEDASRDIWRSQIVFLESALDYYMHCITKYGMNKMFKGEWGKTEKYNNFMVPLRKVEHAMKNIEDTTWFCELVNDVYANDTFMEANSIKNQLNLIGIDIQKVARAAFYDRGSTEKPLDKLKRIINTLFSRRNLIAHQSDRFHENGEKQDIDGNEVQRYIDDVIKIVTSIHEEIKKKNEEG